MNKLFTLGQIKEETKGFHEPRPYIESQSAGLTCTFEVTDRLYV